MKKININGDIIPNDYAWIYQWLEWEHTCPKGVIEQIEAANGEDIEFNINSGGGSVFDAYEIYNAIANYKGNTVAKISLAGSAASFIAMATDKTEIGIVGNIMIHKASNTVSGNANDHRYDAQFLETIDNTIVNAYIEKTGKSREEMLNLMNAETWFTPEQALEIGLVDEITSKKTAKPMAFNSMNNKQEVIDKLLELGSIENVKQALINKELGINGVINAVENTKQNIKEENEMTLDQLKQEHPNLYNQIVQDATIQAVQNERTRIKEIQNLSVPGVEDVINDGIENGLSAGEVAMNIIKNQKEKGTNYMKNAQEDASPIDEVENTPPQPKANKDEEVVTNLAKFGNQRRER